MALGILEHRDTKAGKQTIWYTEDCTKLPTTAWGGLQIGDIVEVIGTGVCNGTMRLACNSVSPLVLASYSGGGIRTVTGSTTLAAIDRFVLNNGSGIVTLQSSSLYPTGAPYTVKAGANALNITLTPASGVFYTATGATAAAATVTTAPLSFITNGTDWFTI